MSCSWFTFVVTLADCTVREVLLIVSTWIFLYFYRRTTSKDFLWWVFTANIYSWFLQQFGCILKVEKCHYHPPTKLCLSVCLQRGPHGTTVDLFKPVHLGTPPPASAPPDPPPPWEPLWPPDNVQICSLGDPTASLDMFRFVHFGKWVIGLRLKGILVLKCIDIYSGCSARTAWSSLSTFNCCNLCS